MRIAAAALLALGVPAVLLKGGHLPSDTIVDLLATNTGVEAFSAARIETTHTHGTGCTTASAVAAGLAQGLTLSASVSRARAYVRAAIAAAPGFGHGHGPLDHAVTVEVDRLTLPTCHGRKAYGASIGGDHIRQSRRSPRSSPQPRLGSMNPPAEP